MGSPQSPTERVVGRLISDRYRVISHVGTGGMGEVFRAEHVVLHRATALKLMRPALDGDPDALARFRREAEQASRIAHPNVAAIYDFGDTGDGLFFLAMEFVEGQSLAERLANVGRLESALAAAVIAQAAEGLAAAHRRGILHRDLKPANMMLAHDGDELVVKLVDFGIARSLLGNFGPNSGAGSPDATPGGTPNPTPLTRTGIVLGTPAYASPEQLAAEPLDARSDVYALALVAFETLTGQAAFASANAREMIVQRLTGQPRRLLDVLTPEQAPWAAAVQPVLDKALDLDPTNRYEDGPPFAAALAAALGVTPNATTSVRITSPNATTAPVTPSKSPSRRVIAIAVAAVLLIAAIGGAMVWRERGGESAVPRLAVLPFENLGAPADDYFVDGLTDDVRSRLAAVPGLRVTARASTRQYSKTQKTPQDIGRELGVDYLLTGTVRWEKDAAGGARVRVTPELVRVSDASVPWTKSLDKVMSDMFVAQADIAQTVAVELNVALAPQTKERITAHPTGNLSAYDEYLKGEQLTDGLASSTPSVLVAALPHYERAVALDSTFARAWSSIARVHAAMPTVTPEDAARAKEAAERAMKLAPQAPESRLAMGAYLTLVKLDYAGALQQYLTGLKDSPNDASLLSAAGNTEVTLGHWEEGIAHLEQAQRLDPRSVIAATRLAGTLEQARQYPKAIAAYDRALALAPSNPRLIQGKVITQLAMGDLDSAHATLAHALTVTDTNTLITHFALFQEMMWVLDPRLWPRLVSLTPKDFGNDLGHFHLKVGGTYKLMGDTLRARVHGDSAVTVFAKSMRDFPEMAQYRELHARALALAGHHAEAIADAEESLKMRETTLDSRTGPYVRWQVARVLIQSGAYDRALDLVEPLLAVRGSDLTPGYLRLDPGFAPLRGNPRFDRLVQRTQ